MSKPENHRHERAKKLISGSGCGYAKGGYVPSEGDEGEPDSGPPNPPKKKSGGACHAEGGSVKTRLDKPKRYASGGMVDDGMPKKKSSAKTQVNIVIAGKGDSPASPMPVPVMPPAPPPGAAPMIPPPGAGMPPGMPPRPPGLKRGGSVKGYKYPIDDGAGGGLGRLEKAAAAKKNHSKKGG